jgi:succinate dehydrogenase / fumarate reductase cytochrome b subunit
MNSLSYVIEVAKDYKGGLGQLYWILHRLTGLGIFAFLALHIVDIYLIGFGPEPFNTLSAIYHLPIMRIGHIGLFFAVVFHALNGLRIVFAEFKPELWKKQQQSSLTVGVLVALIVGVSALLIIQDTFLKAPTH